MAKQKQWISVDHFCFVPHIENQIDEFSHMLHLVGQPLTTEAMDENLPWRRGRLVLLGQGRAGKTSTVRSLVGKPFDKSQSLGKNGVWMVGRFRTLMDKKFGHKQIKVKETCTSYMIGPFLRRSTMREQCYLVASRE